MKTKITSLLIAFLISFSGLFAQNVITVNATDSDISDNLNLEAVATLFGQSKNLQEFEENLNNPKNQISNLDLNQDGYVDYIRVIENYTDGVYIITLQDVLGHDLYQDIATIDVEKDAAGTPQVQIVGNAYIYGPNYIVEPIYVNRPLIYSYFWRPFFKLWVSPYYWNHYPYYFRRWHPYAVFRYRRNIHRWVRPYHYYRHPTYRRSRAAINYEHKIRRNDFERRHPNRSFSHRYTNVKNRHELNLKNRRTPVNRYTRPNNRNNNYNRTTRVNRSTRIKTVKSRNNTNTYRNNRVRRTVPTEKVKPIKRTTVKRSTTTRRMVSPNRTRPNTNRSTYNRSNRTSNKKAPRINRTSPSKKSRAVKARPVKKERVKKKREKR